MSSAAAVKPKLTYRAKSKLEVFYTGGAVCLTRDGKYAICACGDAVKVVEVETGEVKRTFDGDSEPITALAVAPDSTRLYASSRSLTNRSWNLQTGECVRSWKAHKAPVADLALDASGGLLATASADRSLRVWDTDGGFCTHVFNGHEDVVLKALFHPTDLLLFSAGNDSNVFLWDLATRQMAGTLKGHYSAVTSLALSPDARQLVTGGRDKVVIVWDIAARAQMRSIPVFESVEAKNTKKPSAQDGSAFAIATAGESGRIRMWGSATCAELLPAQDRPGASSRDAEPSTAAPEGGIVELCCTANCAEVLAATGDACLRLYEHQAAAGLRKKKLLVGNLDDVTDVRLLGSRKGAGGPPSHVAVATNGADIRIFCLSTLACQASLCGHSDTVLCLDRACTGPAEGDGGAGELLASGSKDNSVRLWSLQQRRCLAVGEGHMASVSAVAFSRKTAGFVVSSGEDKLLKVWDTAAALKASRSATEAEAPVPLLATAGAAAHDKAVNVLAVAPNDQLVCSGSQDRTAKVWQLPSLTLSVTLSGHKRGVLDVAFSPIDRCIATASGDQTLRLWSLADGTCLKTFEGHTASVLRVRFLTAATQLLSSGADGLVRLWTVRSGECVGAFDEHDGKVWAMDVGDKQERLAVTGGQDGCVVVWEDSTVLDEQAAAAEEEQRMALQQSLDNALADSDWGAAMRLALGLRQPRQLLQVVVQALAQGQAKGAAILDALAAGMQPEEVQRALEYCRDWNTNGRSCQPAQALLHALLRRQPPAALLKVPGILSLLDTLSAYTQRHYARLQRLLRSTYLLDYTLSAMQVLVDTDGEADDNSSQRLTEQMVLDKDDVDADAIGRGLKLGLHEAAALYEGDEGYPMGIRNGHVGLGASDERGGDDEDELDLDNGDAMPATASSSEESDDGSEMEEDEPQSGEGSD